MNKIIKLEMDLIPRTCFFSNVRSKVSALEWNKIKRKTSARAKSKCEICNGIGPKWPVECHEIWEYDEISLTQILKGMIALCPSCHQVKHYGFAQIQGKEKQALKHLMKINNWDENYARNYVVSQFQIWDRRSQVEWKLDLSYLEEEFNICF